MSNRARADLVLLLSAAGFLLSATLAFLHLALLRGELLGGILCGELGSVFNCHAVSASRFGRFLGIPLAFWGILGYLAAFALGLIARQFEASAQRAWTALAGLTALFVGIDLVLGFIMVSEIRHACLFCLGTYVVNLAILAVARPAVPGPLRKILRQAPKELAAFLLRPRETASLFFIGVVLTGAAGLWAVDAAGDFFSRSPEGFRRRIEDRIRSAPPGARVDVQGDPQRGAPNAWVQMVQFTDLLCPSCQTAARFGEIILAGHPREVNWVLKHFPLDRSCNDAIERTVHPTACLLAAAAECAHLQGKFWEFHDRLVRRGPDYDADDLEADAGRVGLNLDDFRACLSSGKGLEAVRRDIAQAKRLGVVATPTFIVNGIPIRGTITPAAFEELLAVLKENRSENPPAGGAGDA